MKENRAFNADPFEYHQEIELHIDSLTNMGDGIGRVNGWVVMVPFVIPGERVRVRIYRNHKNYSEGDLVEVLDVSPRRVSAQCPLFGECGGCQYQHMDYGEQLVWKKRHVEELMKQNGGIELNANLTYGSPKQYAYRSKLTPHFRAPKRDGSIGPIGFLRASGGRNLVDVSNCPIATGSINEKLTEERARLLVWAKEAVGSGKKKLRDGTMLLREVSEGVVTDHRATVSEKVGDLTFRFKAGDFFQNNPFILPEFVNYAIMQAAGKGDVSFLVDAYCGSGLFCLSAAKQFKRAAGVEISESSIHWARDNAQLNNITNCDFLVGSAEAIFGKIDFPADATVVLIDPPRKGCDSVFLNQLFAFSPKRVVYVSCDPATQARDIKAFLENGYKVTALQPFDLFPQTRHIESIATLEKR